MTVEDYKQNLLKPIIEIRQQIKLFKREFVTKCFQDNYIKRRQLLAKLVQSEVYEGILDFLDFAKYDLKGIAEKEQKVEEEEKQLSNQKVKLKLLFRKWDRIRTKRVVVKFRSDFSVKLSTKLGDGEIEAMKEVYQEY